MASGLTPRQLDLLTFIRQYTEAHGTSPSYSDMARGIGIASKSGAHRLAHALVERGYLVKEPHRSRAVRLVQADVAVRLPPDLNVTLHSTAALAHVDPNEIVVAALKHYLLDAA